MAENELLNLFFFNLNVTTASEREGGHPEVDLEGTSRGEILSNSSAFFLAGDPRKQDPLVLSRSAYLHPSTAGYFQHVCDLAAGL